MKRLISFCFSFLTLFTALFLAPAFAFAAASSTPLDLNGNGVLDADEAEVIVEADAVLPAGEYHFNALTITNNAKLTAEGNPDSSSTFKGVKITAASLTITPGASLNADGKGYRSGFGPGASPLWYAGASYGGVGIGNISTSTYGSATQPLDLGSGGACSSLCGGGALRLVITGTLTNNGLISANGGSSSSGGSLYITAGTLTGNGTYSANGGDNTLVGCCYSAAGGGGRIAIYYGSSTFTGTSTALGGKSRGAYYFDPVSYAENGTIGFFDTTNNNLTVNSLWRFQANDSPLNFNKIILKNGSRTAAESGASITADELLVDEGSSLTLSGKETGEILALGKLTITGNSTVTIAPERTLSLTIPNLTITSGSSLNTDGKGYGTGFGPGAPANQYYGASYGGVGIGNTASSTYGSATAPTDFGSGSGACTRPSLCGGGALRLIVTDTLANDGIISSNGGGSSSGGSVYVTTNTVTGSGLFSANGGNGTWLGCCYAGAGGGGRVAVYYQNSTFTGTSTALGGKSQSCYYCDASYAGDGTVVFGPQAPTTPPLPAGCSSVAFLPGLEASRLYKDGVTQELWEPHGDADAAKLSLNSDGKSMRSDIYTKDVIDNAYLPAIGNIYKSFLAELSTMKNTDHSIADYSVVPYDWRLSLDEILSSGKKSGDHISYLEATSSPYIIAELRRLAATSKTGKVTIVAHSNGGLLAKALTQKLGSEASSLIDQIIFVAVPQAGTPKAIGAILHGFDQELPVNWFPSGLSRPAARELAKNMPSAYNFLPSLPYFTYIDDPVITFDNSALLSSWRTKYGDTIHSGERLHNFLADQTRAASSADLSYPIAGNTALLNRSELLHAMLDNWTPPAGITLTEIAGWGEETVKTIVYEEGVKGEYDAYGNLRFSPSIQYDVKRVLDGDGTVVVPSALWTPGAGKYWVDLKTYGESGFHGSTINRKHADILEVPQLRTFIQNTVKRDIGTLSQYTYISTSTPPNTNTETRLHFTLHSPLSLDLYDNLGNHTGISTTTNFLEENVPGSRYETFGELKYISTPTGTPLRLSLRGYATGSFTLDVEKVQGDTILASTTFAGIPSSTSTVATMNIPQGGNIASSSPLVVDENGDGRTDILLLPKQGGTSLPDITPPEAILSFSTTTGDIVLSGKDDLSPIVSITPLTLSTSTLVYVLGDQSGNSASLSFSKTKKKGGKDEKEGELQAKLFSISYTTLSTTTKSTFPENAIEYEWEKGKDSSFTELTQKFKLQKNFTIRAAYDAKKNQTKIFVKEKTSDEKLKETKQGLVILRLMTKKGELEAVY